MTTEPPKGLRANLLRLYNGISEDSFKSCKAQGKYQKLLFALAYFHSVLLERRKFRSLGLNIPYDFNDTDFGWVASSWGQVDKGSVQLGPVCLRSAPQSCRLHDCCWCCCC
jgi:hypothetical protein